MKLACTFRTFGSPPETFELEVSSSDGPLVRVRGELSYASAHPSVVHGRLPERWTEPDIAMTAAERAAVHSRLARELERQFGRRWRISG